MKFIIGPGVNQLTILNKDGEDITNQLHVTRLHLSMETNEAPKACMDLEIFGEKHEIEVKEEEVTAILKKNGVQKIESLDLEESPFVKEITLADIHPNP